MDVSEAEIRAEIETKIRSVEKVVRDLEAKIGAFNEELEKGIHRREVIKEFFRLEYGNIPNGDGIAHADSPLFTIPKRFENSTIRESCRQILQGVGGMHVADIAKIIETGGRPTTKNSVTSVLVRGDEFGRTQGKQNTFYLIEEDSNASPD